jgi:2-polyprenyl-3-methyl-5-hydroxy-6-metoxy-1,4-benzoquinol methylase
MSLARFARSVNVRRGGRGKPSTSVADVATPVEKPTGYYACDRAEMLAFVPPSVRRILDVGCGEGSFGRSLKGRDPEITLYGIEVEPAPATRATAWYDNVITGEFPADLPADVRELDCAVFNDVLEHLIDPWAALRALHNHLADDAVIVASIPNLRYLPVLYKLLVNGTFTYTPTGVLDQTHLRFFTKKSIVELFESTGYSVDSIQGINPLERWQIRFLRAILPAFANDVRFIEYAVVARRHVYDRAAPHRA